MQIAAIAEAARCPIIAIGLAAEILLRADIPAAALANSVDLVASDHLLRRSFWDLHGTGVIPGLPRHASFGRVTAPAPTLGADTETVLGDVLGYSAADIAALRQVGPLG